MKKVKNSSKNNFLKVILFLGYPGSGKGTQGKILSKKLSLSHISTGELFRKEAKTNSEIGKKMKDYMDKGEIIPKELTFEYLENFFKKEKNYFILDGYPKNEESLTFLKKNVEIQKVFYFKIERQIVLERLSKRKSERTDDTPEAINKRLNLFEKETKPLLEKMEYITINASLKPEEVTEQILKYFNEGSYYLRKPKKEKSSVFHNHIDAKDEKLLIEIVSKIESKSEDFQNKIYPIRDLVLSSQSKEEIYNQLPNFHKIENAIDEAFSTGKMGENINYKQILTTLEVCSCYPNQGVMTEVEEDIYEKVFDEEGKTTIVLDKGNTPFQIDWNEFPEKYSLKNSSKKLPKFELHHGFNIKKNNFIDLNWLCQITKENGFNNGGWFIFKNKDYYCYRSNEFSNESYEHCLEKLNNQAEILRKIIKTNFDFVFTNSCSLEKVHAIWNF